MNVAKQAEKLINELEKTGEFNSINIEDIEKTCCWHEQYAMFVIFFDTYDQTYFDLDGFNCDFKCYVESYFPNCKIKSYPSCGEWEIIGPKYDEFYAKYEDQIEEFNEKYEHGVFTC